MVMCSRKAAARVGLDRGGFSEVMLKLNPEVEWELTGKRNVLVGCPIASAVKYPPANAGDVGLIPDPRRSHMLPDN